MKKLKKEIHSLDYAVAIFFFQISGIVQNLIPDWTFSIRKGLHVSITEGTPSSGDVVVAARSIAWQKGKIPSVTIRLIRSGEVWIPSEANIFFPSRTEKGKFTPLYVKCQDASNIGKIRFIADMNNNLGALFMETQLEYVTNNARLVQRMEDEYWKRINQ